MTAVGDAGAGPIWPTTVSRAKTKITKSAPKSSRGTEIDQMARQTIPTSSGTASTFPQRIIALQTRAETLFDHIIYAINENKISSDDLQHKGGSVSLYLDNRVRELGKILEEITEISASAAFRALAAKGDREEFVARARSFVTSAKKKVAAIFQRKNITEGTNAEAARGIITEYTKAVDAMETTARALHMDWKAANKSRNEAAQLKLLERENARTPSRTHLQGFDGAKSTSTRIHDRLDAMRKKIIKIPYELREKKAVDTLLRDIFADFTAAKDAYVSVLEPYLSSHMFKSGITPDEREKFLAETQKYFNAMQLHLQSLVAAFSDASEHYKEFGASPEGAKNMRHIHECLSTMSEEVGRWSAQIDTSAKSMATTEKAVSEYIVRNNIITRIVDTQAEILNFQAEHQLTDVPEVAHDPAITDEQWKVITNLKTQCDMLHQATYLGDAAQKNFTAALNSARDKLNECKNPTLREKFQREVNKVLQGALSQADALKHTCVEQIKRVPIETPSLFPSKEKILESMLQSVRHDIPKPRES